MRKKVPLNEQPCIIKHRLASQEMDEMVDRHSNQMQTQI